MKEVHNFSPLGETVYKRVIYENTGIRLGKWGSFSYT